MRRRHSTVIAAAMVIALLSSEIAATRTDAAVPPGGNANATQTAQRLPSRLAADLGGRPFSGASPWNTRTPTGTRWFDSIRIHRLSIPVNGSDALHWWVNTGSVGVHYAKSTDPLWTFDLPALNAVPWNRVRPASTFTVRAPANMADGGDSDHVLVLVSGDTYYEVWNAQVNQATRRVTGGSGGANWAVGSISTGSGAGTPGTNDGTRASNFSWAAGLITGDDIQRHSIDHALVLSLTTPILKAGPNPDFVYPATAWDNGGSYGPVKMGSRIGIPPGTARPAGLSAIGNMVFDALVSYGAFVGDFCGGPWPMFYADKYTVTESQMLPLYAFWEYGGSADMDKIQPLLRVADYQP